MKKLFFVLCVLLIMPVVTYAQSPDFDNKTYFTVDRYDRIYFAADGSFQQQLEDAFHTLAAGSILRGKWAYDNNNAQLCMTYQQFGIAQHCFTITKITHPSDIPLVIAKGSDGEDHFLWRQWRDGNWLLTPAGLQAVKLSYDNKNIRNSIALDNQLNEYVRGKIYSADTKFYFKDHKSGFYTNDDKIIKPMRWAIGALRIRIFDMETDAKLIDIPLTLGTEFLIPKSRAAHLYTSKDQLLIEGENFDLQPFADSPHQSIFEPAISTAVE